MKTDFYDIQYLFKAKRTILILSFLAANLIVANAFAQRKAWVTPNVSTKIKNPFAGNKSALADGQKLYATNCSPCHGSKGKGDGAAAVALTPKPADHTSALVQSETDGSLFWKLSTGRNPMPSYQKILTDKQRWELVSYIRTLRKKG